MVYRTSNLNFSKPMVCIPICFFLISISLFIHHHQYKGMAFSRIRYFHKGDFQAINLTDRIYTFFNVCIEALKHPKLTVITTRLGDRMIFNETKRIVVYQNGSQPDGAVARIKLAGNSLFSWDYWEIQFQHVNLPNDRLKNLRDAAFFVQSTFTGNFHHFFLEELVPLFSVIKLSNRLHPWANNQILYRTPQVGEPGDRNFGRRSYEELRRTLYINDFQDVFYNLPDNTCFKNAVFGNWPLFARQRDVIDHVLKFYNVPSRSNVNDSQLFVTIQSRRDRRIINVDELVTFAKGVGFPHVRIVDFNGISILDQLKIMSTTNVLIGPHGAGLQWASFMPEGSYLIELAWPQKHWPFSYRESVSGYDITWKGVGVDDVRLNWTSYERNVRNGVPVSEEEKPKLIESHPKGVRDNIWKWSDIVVKKTEILGTLETVYKGLHKSANKSLRL